MVNKLLEDSRSELINKSKRSDLYNPDNRDFGKNRHQRRLKSKISKSVKEYNQINMNKLFKDDILDVYIRVNGETNAYLVQISFNGFLNSLAKFLGEDADENRFDFRIVLKSLLDAFNHSDVHVHCQCPDFQYREAYWATVNGINAGAPEKRPSDETNPNDTKGLCKHINLVLNNNSWMMKVASVIHNYVNYMKEHYEKLYADIIYPSIYNREYEEPVQLDMIDDMENMTGDELIDTSNKWARTRGQFKKDNPYRYTTQEEPEVQGQQKIFDVDSVSNEDESQDIEDNEDEDERIS